MKISLISGIGIGFIGSFFASTFSSILGSAGSLFIFFISIASAGIISGFDKKILHRMIGLISFYTGSFLGFLIHTILFESYALFGVLVLILYSIIIIPLYLIFGVIGSKIFN